MLRDAAAAAAWILVPVFGYIISNFTSSNRSSSDCSKPEQQQQMMYKSKGALPSEWDKRQWVGRHQTLQQYLKVDGLTVKYVGPGENDSQAASIFADHPVPPDVPLYYFEVTIISKGAHGYIGVGFCSDDVNPGRLPGWEPHSYGYHGDDGHAFHGSGTGRAFGPRFTTGDVIGALLDRARRTISFYKNGESVGTAFYDVQEQNLYPCVGMRTSNEEIRANFGRSPFTVDLTDLQDQFKERVLDSISAVQLPVAVDLHAAPAAAAAAAGLRPGSKKGLAAAPVAAAAAAAAAGGGGARQSGDAGAGSLEPAARAILAAMGTADRPAAAAAAAASAADSEGAAAGAATGAAAEPDESGTGAGSNSKAASGAVTGRWSQPLLPYLIFDYLLHQRCWKTATIVARDMLGSSSSSSSSKEAMLPAAAGSVPGDAAVPMECSTEDQAMSDADAAAAAGAGPSSAAAAGAGAPLSEADIQDALLRQQVFDAVCEGRVAEALDSVAASYGSEVLSSNPRLSFKLKVQQFVELVRAAGSSGSAAEQTAAAGGASASNGSSAASTACYEAALAYGRAELGPGSKSPEDEELLSDALSLLAYGDPAASPCGHLLRPGHRVQLAEELNGALLKARGTSAQPLLETMYRQSVVLVEELKRHSVPAALVLDVPGLCLTGTAGLRRTQKKKGQASSSAAAAATAEGLKRE